MHPPTRFLPGIKSISVTPSSDLHDSIIQIRKIYNPPVRGARRRKRAPTLARSAQISPAESIEQQNAALDELRTDSFERNYVLRWLTSVVAHLTSLSEVGSDEESASKLSNHREAESILVDAAALLAICAGTASAGIISRVFTAPIHLPQSLALPKPSIVSVNLRDVPLDNQDYGSVGAQTWGGACVMAEMLAEDPGRFGLLESQSPSSARNPQQPFRILELGAGTGLVSLAIASFYRTLFTHQPGGRDVEIIATDYYPSVLDNLNVNLGNNGFGSPLSASDSSTSPILSLSSCPLDWSTFAASPSSSDEAPLQRPFDMAFGADIVYEKQHAVWIKACLEKLLPRLADASPPAFFHLIIPLRSTHAYESGTIETVFGSRAGGGQHLGELGLTILEKEIIECDVDGGEGDEVVYAYYKIGWA